MHIDEALRQAYRKDPNQIVDIIVIAQAATDALLADLEAQGVEILSQQQRDFGMLYGRIHLSRLPALEQINGIKSITLDTTQHAF